MSKHLRIAVIIGIPVALVAALIIITTRRNRVEQPTLDVQPEQPKSDQVRTIMERHLVHRGGQPVNSFLLYVENEPDDLVIHHGVGVVGRTDDAIDADYQYNVASITKTVVATIVLQLMEEGHLTLEDSITQYLEDVDYVRVDDLHILNGASRTDDIMIDHLLMHRSGLGDFFIDAATPFNISVLLNRGKQYSTEEIMATYYKYELNEAPHFAPGEGYYYSDTNYVLLGLIIEQITGESLPDQIRERILTPLEMDDTYFEFYEPPVTRGKRIDTYLGPLNMTRYINTSYEWGGGGLVSTTEEMATFIQALFNMELFQDEATLALMTDNTANQGDDATYARGINIYTVGEETYYGHGGFYGSLLLHNPEKGLTLSGHVAQANLPYDIEPAIEAILAIAKTP